jgi:hypothetical protein
LTERRNDYLHAAYSRTREGQALMQDADHVWGPAPTADQVQAVTDALLTLYKTLNDARLRGFIADIGRRSIKLTNEQSSAT